MKRFILFVFLVNAITLSYGQNYTVESSYQPLSTEEMIVSARANVNRFQKYQDKADVCFKKGDYEGYIYYSDFALKCGYYTAKMYYNRGIAYEKLHNYSKAKKSFKKALKKGYYPAKEALTKFK
nr:MAG TPA: Glutamyl-tRNA reductase 1 [Crassvirales sp.]